MSESTELPDADFDTQLRGLFQEAEQKIQGRLAAASSKPEVEKEAPRAAEERALRAYSSLPQMLRPMVLGLEAVSRATGENSVLLQKLDKAAEEATGAQRALPKLVSGLESLLEQRNGVSQRMFDALHEELKSYKDGFLMESVLRPIVRDLISLYDDLEMIHGQMQQCVGLVRELDGGPLSERFKTIDMNIAHHCEFVLEILERLEVVKMPAGTGKLDKHSQRAVAIEPTDDPEQDMTVARTVKRGFICRQRVLRAEEVVMRRWKQGSSASTSSGADSQK
jgi:molecular chaperone GrpE (heat shock protein)